MILTATSARPQFIKATQPYRAGARTTEGVKEALILANSVNIKKVKLTI